MTSADPCPDPPPTPASVRPAVYGRNYSYFSHRIFVAFMPEDLHKYLHDRLELAPPNPAQAITPGQDSDAIDIHLVRWVLLHRSQLNALALNRELEAWRGAGDVFAMPPDGRLRTERAYCMDITLQFAVELELATALESDLMKNRPRLLLPLLDAAYFVSRRRGGQDRRENLAPDSQVVDIDLSEAGQEAFRAYLVQRMNLDEDKGDERAKAPGAPPGPGPSTGTARGPLTEQEVNWLHGVALAVARTLSSSASLADLTDRWHKVHDARWKARDLPLPDKSFFDALLIGSQSPLEAVSVTDAEVRRTGASPMIDSLRFRWRFDQFGPPPWAQSLMELAQQSAPTCAFIAGIDETLRLVMLGKDRTGAAKAAGDLDPLSVLSERYRVIPTTPAWPSVSEALHRMRLAGTGQGNTDVLIRDGRLVRQYAETLIRSATSEAASYMLLAGSALAGLLAGVRRPAPTFPDEQPSIADWRIALDVLHDGLRLDKSDAATAAERLAALYRDLALVMPALPPLLEAVVNEPDPETLDWRSATALRATWLLADTLADAVHAVYVNAYAFAASRAEGGPLDDALVAQAYPHLLERLRRLCTGQDGSLPAHAYELVCHVLGIGPARLLPLRLADAGARRWTEVLRQTLRGRQTKLRDDSPLSMALAAHALERLGAGALRDDVRQVILDFLTPASEANGALQDYARQHGLWSQEGTSGLIAVVVGGGRDAIADQWPLPPTGGFLLAGTEANLQRLVTAGLGGALKLAVEPVRIVFEPWTSRAAEVDQLETWSRQLPNQNALVRIWMYRAGGVVIRTPSLVDPQSADDLWSAGGSGILPVA
jgi:hypothetical protein